MIYNQGDSYVQVLDDGQSIYVYSEDSCSYTFKPYGKTDNQETGIVYENQGVTKLGPFYVQTSVFVTADSGKLRVESAEFEACPVESTKCGFETLGTVFDKANTSATTVTNVRPTQSGQLFNSSQAVYSADSAVTIANAIMIPSDYEMVQLTWFHRGGGGAVVGAKVVVGGTDDIGDLSNAATNDGRMFVCPFRDGVRKNAIASDGWSEVTWAGSSTLDLDDSGSDDFTYITSDVIDVSSVPIIGDNAARFAGYRALLVRMYAGTGVYSKGGQADWASTAFIDEVGPNVVLGAARAGDLVANLSSWNEQVSVSFGDDKTLPCIVQAYKSDPSAHSTLVVGDSRFASGSTEDPTREYRNMTFFLQLAATEGGGKLNCSQMAHQGMPQTTYHLRAMSYLDNAGFVENAVYLCHSINDGTPSEANIAASKRQTMLFVDKCISKGVTPILITAFPLDGGYTEGQLSLLNGFSDFVAGLGYRYFSPLAEYGDTTGEWLLGFGTGDSHMTDTGYQDLAGRIYALVKSTWL